MPKVTEKYKKEKADKIVKATIEVLKIKPLYDITMLDIIKTAGLSKGGIYLYFKDIDELLVEAINRIGGEQDTIEFTSLLDDESIESSLVLIFEELGNYIDSCPAIIGKIRFELMIYISNNPEKADTIMSKLQLKNVGIQFMENVAILIQKGIKQNVFSKEIPIEIVINNVSAYIDGITDMIVSSIMYGGKPLQHPTREYFQQFVQSQILLLKK
ncbi:MAG: TetR family transcriptional regulator [Anaerocolumna sp.]|jgi:AcrR family transcriptional regulator|nr:TetR family transcriptional regulator [Anaerocolumna sp.]